MERGMHVAAAHRFFCFAVDVGKAASCGLWQYLRACAPCMSWFPTLQEFRQDAYPRGCQKDCVAQGPKFCCKEATLGVSTGCLQHMTLQSVRH